MGSGRRPSRSSMVAASMREVLVGFCRWTSVRGMPHVVRSENPYMAATWATFVVLMCVVNMILVGLLLLRYSSYNTIENIKRERNASVEFPSVTVCNVDPVNTDRIYCLRNISQESCDGLDRFPDALSAYDKVKSFLSSENNAPILSLMEDTSKISIFYQLIGMLAASAIGHQKDDFIIRDFCRVWYFEPGGNQVEKSCTDAKVVFDQLVTYNHFNCYTLTVNDTAISRAVRRLSMVLYLDEEEDLKCRPHCTHEFTEVGGGKAVVHPTRTYPEIDKRGVNLLPGASNQLLINEVRKTMNKFPRGSPCSSDANTLQVATFNTTQNGTKIMIRKDMEYTSMLCSSLNFQKAIMDNCACVDALLPLPWKDSHKQLVFCGNINQTDAKKRLECKRRIKAELQGKILKDCQVPCNSLEYFVELTQLRWPQKPQILNHYKKIKDRVYFKRKLKIYEEIDNMSNFTQALKKLQSTDIFEKNFLQMEVLRTSFDIIQYKEEMEYTLTTFLSQIGGICGMFIGFTFVTFLELTELVCRLMIAWQRATKEADRHSVSEAEAEPLKPNGPDHVSNSPSELEELCLEPRRPSLRVTRVSLDKIAMERESVRYLPHADSSENLRLSATDI